MKKVKESIGDVKDISDVSKRKLKKEVSEALDNNKGLLDDILEDNKLEIDLSIGKVSVFFRWEFDSQLNRDRARLDAIHLDDIDITNKVSFFDLIKVYSIIRLINRKVKEIKSE